MIIRCLGFFNNKAVAFVFFASVLLSIVAILDRAVISKDGALYVYVAQYVSVNGLGSAFDLFDWPWYSILIALISNVSGIPHDVVAYVLSVIFMAGTCALVVSMVDKVFSEARWWAVLLVLSVPVYNEFRGEIIRESGYWFFVVLSIWLVLSKAKESVSWSWGALFQLSVIYACLFRLEAVFLVFAVGFYFFIMDRGSGFRGGLVSALKFSSLFFVFLLSAFIYIVFFDAQLGFRVAHYSNILNPLYFIGSVEDLSDQFANAALRRWSHSDATVIVVSGMLFALVWRIIGYAGVSSFLLLFPAGRLELLKACSRFKLNLAAISVYFCVLFIFFIQMKFVNSRYAAVLLLMAVPLLSVAVYGFSKRHKKAGRLIVYVSLVFMLANVVSFSDKKTHYIPIANWIKNNTSEEDRVHYDDPRIAYYAGRPWPENSFNFQQILDQGRQDDYDYLMLEVGKNGEKSEAAMAEFETLAEFSTRKRTIYILTKKDSE